MAKRKILIVDDDQDTRQGLNVRLRANNYDTVLASDAISAVSLAQKVKPDLIILDIGLPGGDGFMVMERLKASAYFASIPFIVVTASDPSTNKERALDAGAKAFLQKPVDNDELLATIRKALGESERKILIVDDDQDTRQGLNVRLRANNYDTVLASDAISAISAARKLKPDLIILDIGLPGGDGFMVMEQLGSLYPATPIPVIILSARDPSTNKERALDAGAKAFLQKPVDNDELLATIRWVLEGSSEPMKEKV